MANRITLYRRLLRSLYLKLETLEDKPDRLERRYAPLKKISLVEDDIESCEDDIDVVEGLLKRLLRKKKKNPVKKPTKKPPVRKPFQAPPVRKPVHVQKPSRQEIVKEEYEYDSDDEERYASRYGDEALDDLLEELEEYEELDDYINEEMFELEDEDFYGEHAQ